MQLLSKSNKNEITSKLSDNRSLLRIIQEHKKELYFSNNHGDISIDCGLFIECNPVIK